MDGARDAFASQAPGMFFLSFLCCTNVHWQIRQLWQQRHTYESERHTHNIYDTHTYYNSHLQVRTTPRTTSTTPTRATPYYDSHDVTSTTRLLVWPPVMRFHHPLTLFSIPGSDTHVRAIVRAFLYLFSFCLCQRVYNCLYTSMLYLQYLFHLKNDVIR